MLKATSSLSAAALLLVILVLAGVMVGPSTLQAQDLEERVLQALSRQAATGAIVAVVHADSILFVRSFGYLDQEGTREMPPDQLFYLSSVGTPLLGALAVRLARKGIVDLDVPVARWAPGLPPRLGEATLAQLLTETAGLDDSPLLARGAGEAPESLPPDRQIELLSDGVLTTDPGMLRSVSQYSHLLAGHVLATAAGRSLDELLGEEVLAPGGMDGTVLSTEEALARGAEPGWVLSQSPDRPFAPAPLPQDELLPAHRRGWTTAHDLAELLRLWLGSGTLAASGVEDDPPPGSGIAEAFSLSALPLVPDPFDASGAVRWGFGWQIGEFEGFREVRAIGGGAGHVVALHVLPELHLGMVVLTNGGTLMSATSPVLEELMAGLAGVDPPGDAETAAAAGLFPFPVVAAPEPVLSPGPEHVGRYRNGSEILVLVEGPDGLAADMGTAEPLAIRVHDDGILTGHIADGRQALLLRMVTDREGRVYLILRDRAFLMEPDA